MFVGKLAQNPLIGGAEYFVTFVRMDIYETQERGIQTVEISSGKIEWT